MAILDFAEGVALQAVSEGPGAASFYSFCSNNSNSIIAKLSPMSRILEEA